MTKDEARELYLSSDCSYFAMCTYHHASYLQYRQLGIPKRQEALWREEKLRALLIEIQKTGDYRIFNRIYEIAAEFRDYKKLRMLLEALRQIKHPLTNLQYVDLAETILGRKLPQVRSGIIYWAYDVGQKGIAILLMDQALQFLEVPYVSDIELDKRIRKGKRLCRKINLDLKLNFSDNELKRYPFQSIR